MGWSWGEVKGLEEVLDRKCDNHQGGVKGTKNECQLMERCDGYGEVLGAGEV